jgi:propanol-preferring alcohol dehydrogenase
LGIAQTCTNSIKSLRKAGRHLQIGITTKSEAGHISVPIDEIVKRELTLLGSVGMPAHEYAAMIPLVSQNRIHPGKLLNREISLSEVESVFREMTTFTAKGTFVVTKFF